MSGLINGILLEKLYDFHSSIDRAKFVCNPYAFAVKSVQSIIQRWSMGMSNQIDSKLSELEITMLRGGVHALPSSVEELENLLISDAVAIDYGVFQSEIDVIEEQYQRKRDEARFRPPELTEKFKQGLAKKDTDSLRMDRVLTINLRPFIFILVALADFISVFEAVRIYYTSPIGIVVSILIALTAVLAYVLVGYQKAIFKRQFVVEHRNRAVPPKPVHMLSLAGVFHFVKSRIFSFGSPSFSEQEHYVQYDRLNMVHNGLIVILVISGILSRVAVIIESAPSVIPSDLMSLGMEVKNYSSLVSFQIDYLLYTVSLMDGGYILLQMSITLLFLLALDFMLENYAETLQKALGNLTIDFLDPRELEKEKLQAINALKVSKLKQAISKRFASKRAQPQKAKEYAAYLKSLNSEAIEMEAPLAETRTATSLNTTSNHALGDNQELQKPLPEVQGQAESVQNLGQVGAIFGAKKSD